MRSRWAAILLATMAAFSSHSVGAAQAKGKARSEPASVKRTARAKPAEKPQKGEPAEKNAKREPSAKVEKPSPASPASPTSAKPAPKQAERGARIRRAIAGGPVEKTPPPDGESPELRMLREVDLELFPAFPRASDPNLPAPIPLDPRHPVVHASGLPKQEPLPLLESEAERDLSWLRTLTLPDLPARWDARVLRYLEYYRDHPRGRLVASIAIRRSGRWASAIRATLRAHGLPEDLVWASLVESAFNPTARSRAGAAGLWQFMPETARIYGLAVDASFDERLDPERATEAAARHLGDLYRRFGSWELALAAYNMGYGGLLSAIRKFNTNDYWELGRWESGIPWETTLYVPKIIAMSIVARNPEAFGLEGVQLDPPVESDAVPLPPGISLKSIASAAGVAESEIASLNPQLRAGKTPSPPSKSDEAASFLVRVPLGLGPAVAKRFSVSAGYEGKLERHVVRFGESLDSIAKARGISKARLVELNGLREGESLRKRPSLLAPPSEASSKASAVEGEEKPVVVVPPTPFEHEGHRRVFYRVIAGDSLAEIADAFGVLPDDLRRWNALDPSARLHDGMSLQLFVREEANLGHVLYREEEEARVLTVGSEDFYAHFEGLRGRQRAVVVVQAGDTWQKLGTKYGLSLGQLERINRRPRSEALVPGETVVVYAPIEKKVVEASLAEGEAKSDPEPLPAMEPPNPEDLPEAPDEDEPRVVASPSP